MATTWRKYFWFLFAYALYLLCIGSFVWSHAGSSRTAMRADTAFVQQDSTKVTAALDQPDMTVPAVVPAESTQPYTSKTPIKTVVQVNGEQIPVPATGTVHKVIQSTGGTTTVDVSTNTSSSGDTNTSVSTNIDLNSVTRSSSDESE